MSSRSTAWSGTAERRVRRSLPRRRAPGVVDRTEKESRPMLAPLIAIGVAFAVLVAGTTPTWPLPAGSATG